jgi:pilus assembly protein CpaB
MKKYGALIALGFAVLFGVLAVFMANRLMTQKAPEVIANKARESLAVTKIVIAAKDINIGTPLTSDLLTMAEWPKANVPKGALYGIDEIKDRVAVTKLSAGEPLLKAELAEPGSGAGLVALIPLGARAMSIRVDEVIGVAGFILPNTYVDVVHVDTDTNNKQDQSSIIIEKVKVLAIAQETYTDEEGGKAKIVRTVTLQLTPEEATLLALKTRKGSIHLLLRSPLEEKSPTPPPKPVVVKKKVAPPPPPPPPKPKAVPELQPRIIVMPKPEPPKPKVVEVYRGVKKDVVEFPDVESEEITKK